jgi:uncharacterized protein YodC (DUF2158 family)
MKTSTENKPILCVGDVVVLKSGGPKMTITYIDSVNYETPSASVIWINQFGSLSSFKIPVICLTKAEEKNEELH